MPRAMNNSLPMPSMATVLGAVLGTIMLVVGVIVVGQFVQEQLLISRLTEHGADYAKLGSFTVRGDVVIENGHSVSFGPDVTDPVISGLHHDLRSLANLKLDVANSSVGDEAMKSLADATNILGLNLEHTRVTSDGAKYVATLRNLRTLNLGSCPLTDDGLAHLAKLDQLGYLYLGSTLITDAGLPRLGPLTQLKELVIGYGAITPQGADALRRLLPNTNVRRIGPPYEDELGDLRVTEDNGVPIPEDGGELVDICNQYFEALHKRDAFTMKSLWSPSVRISFKTISDEVLEIRPTTVKSFSGYMNDEAATVTIYGPVPDGGDVQYDVQFAKEEGEWKIVRLGMVF